MVAREAPAHTPLVFRRAAERCPRRYRCVTNDEFEEDPMMRIRIRPMRHAATLALAAACVMLSAGAGAGGGPDSIKGGRMWDKWWIMLGIDPPAGEHPLNPPEGQQSGSTTFRCKECHGWDYKGAAGAYGKGSSHYTGIPGVFGSTMGSKEMFELLALDQESLPNGHGYTGCGMSDDDIRDVVEFVQTLVIDTDDYIDDAGVFMADVAQGEINFTKVGSPPCAAGHGPDGTWFNFGDPDDPEWIGTHAVHNPWELMHKARFGQPGTGMPSWVESGRPDQGVADIGLYAQENFPTTTCAADVADPLNGRVDRDDLGVVLDNWGGFDVPGDVNDDGVVDFLDVLLVLSGWGLCPDG